MLESICRISGIKTEYECVDLSSRQIGCLTWAALGKTANETASILSLSAPTVIFHLENSKRKLGATTISQAVVRAMQLGLISL